MELPGDSMNEEIKTALMLNCNERKIDNVGLTKVTVSLLQLMEETGYRLEQINGQRRYGGPPPNWLGPPPLRGSEIFVGKIPRNCFEDELVPIFEKVGRIYELRLMMDFSGSNRGYCFVMYSTPEIADLAVAKLNDYQIREGRHIGVVKSVNNCRLFIGGLPSDRGEDDIKLVLCRLTEGVMEVWFFKNSGKFRHLNPNVRYAIVEYDSHRSAAMARRRLIPERVELWGREIIVDWATPNSNLKPTDQDFHEEMFKMGEDKTTVPPILSCNSQSGDSGIGTISSCSSSNWSLEQLMDDVLYGNSCIESSALRVTEHNNTNTQLAKTDMSSPEVHLVAPAAIKSHTGTSYSPISLTVNKGVVKGMNGLGDEMIRSAVAGVTNYVTHLKPALPDKKTRFYQHYQENLFHDEPCSQENIDPTLGMQETQIRNFRPMEQIYMNGATRTQILFSDFLGANKNVQNTAIPIRGRSALTELSQGQAHVFENTGRIGRQSLGAIKDSRVGTTEALNVTLPSYLNISGSNVKGGGLSSSWMGNETLSFQEIVPSPKFDENSSPTIGKINVNDIWARGKRGLSFEERVSIVGLNAAAASLGEATSWAGKQNLAARLESASASNVDPHLLIGNITPGGSLLPWEGRQEVSPNASNVSANGCDVNVPFCSSNIFHKIAEDQSYVDVNIHSSNFNRAPGGPLHNAGRNNIVSQSGKILNGSSFGNLF